MNYKLKTIGLIAAGMIALSACTPQQALKSYTVEGVVADSSANGKTIYIMRYDNNRYIDSTLIANGRFTFQGKTDSAYFCRIDVNRDEFASFILEPGSIQVDLKAHSNPSGTPRNAEMVRLNTIEDSLRKVTANMWESIQQQYKEEGERDEAMKKALDEQAQRIADWADAYFQRTGPLLPVHPHVRQHAERAEKGFIADHPIVATQQPYGEQSYQQY